MSFYEEISRNKRTTYLLFLAFFVLIFVVGYVFSYLMDSYIFVPIFGIFAIIYILFTYYNSDKIITAISGAKQVTKEQQPKFHNIVEEMTIAGGLPKPKLYVIHDRAINAFATGRDPEHSVVCVTTGAIEKLSRAELTGVVAHEMSHIKNYDIRVMTIAAVLVGLSVLLSDFLLRMFLWGSLGGNRGSPCPYRRVPTHGNGYFWLGFWLTSTRMAFLRCLGRAWQKASNCHFSSRDLIPPPFSSWF